MDDFRDIKKIADEASMSSSSSKSIQTLEKTQIFCVDLFDRMMYCGTPVNQLNKYYQTGNIEQCSAFFFDLATCMYAKTVRDEQKRKEKLDSITSLQTTGSKNSVLPLKSSPSWPS